MFRILIMAMSAVAGFGHAQPARSAITFTQHPASPTTATTATFGWTSGNLVKSFKCKVTPQPGPAPTTFQSCTSPYTVTSVPVGSWTFTVRGFDKNGVQIQEASWTWIVEDQQPPPSTMPVGDKPGWTQVFAADFNETVPLGSWPDAVIDQFHAYPCCWGDTSRHGRHNPAKVFSQHDGMLDYWLHPDTDGVPLVGAPVPMMQTMLYGEYTVRWKADPVYGYKSAWLLWPDSETWPRDGEIDFPEGPLNGTVSAYTHRQDATTGGDQDAFNTNVLMAGSWHTTTIEWLPGSVRYTLDGVEVGHSTLRVPNTPMHWVLQTETNLGAGPWPGPNDSGHVLIDWLVAYKPA